MSSYREMLLSLLGDECERCHSRENLELHHKDRNRMNNDIRNIQLLCRECHSGVHSRRKIGEGKRVVVNFTDEQWMILEKFRGVFGHRDSEIVRHIIIAYLSEKNFLRSNHGLSEKETSEVDVIP